MAYRWATISSNLCDAVQKLHTYTLSTVRFDLIFLNDDAKTREFDLEAARKVI